MAMAPRFTHVLVAASVLACSAAAAQMTAPGRSPAVEKECGTFAARDGVALEYCEVFSPAGESASPIVVHFQGSGVSTLVHPVLDLIWNRAVATGFHVFSCNKRGVRRDPADPAKETVDEKVYARSGYHQLLRDAEDMVRFVLGRPGVRERGIVCLGQSEGAIVAAHVADRFPNDVRAVFAVGPPILPPAQTIEEQMVDLLAEQTLAQFDANGDARLDAEELANVPAEWTQAFFLAPLKDSLGATKTALALEDLKAARAAHLQRVLASRDDAWTMRIGKTGVQYVLDSYEVEGNETRLMRLSCPVFLFQGEKDLNCPPRYLERLRRHLRFNPRPNIHIVVQPGVGHALDLNRQKPFWNELFAELAKLGTAR